MKGTLYLASLHWSAVGANRAALLFHGRTTECSGAFTAPL